MKFIEVTLLAFICFTTLLSLTDCRSTGSKEKCEVKCPPPCTGVSTNDGIANLYKLYDLPPLVQKYRDAVLSLMNDNCVSASQKNVLTIQSLYIMDCVSGFNPGVSISCVLTDYIRAAANRKKNETAFQIAAKNFNDYTFTVAGNSVRLGLMASGCSVPPSTVPQTGTFPKCKIDNFVYQYLENNVDLPAKIKCIIKDLLKSCNEAERNAGLIAIAAASSENAAFWSQLMNSGPDLLNALKLKSCTGKIPPQCCSKRKEQLSQSIDKLFETMRRLMQPKCDSKKDRRK